MAETDIPAQPDDPDVPITKLHPRAEWLLRGANQHNLVPQQAVAHDHGSHPYPKGWGPFVCEVTSPLDNADVAQSDPNSGVKDDDHDR